ncbi:hypothetical protein [Arthrobacter sp. Soil763]|uniref:hypothetical protein n=1 Tax=Arthrobacter sp. Soil763 TaxID=1736402 RepID=UPI0006FD47E1|nr:hypothetical protein [Arthrobacter sp. Soil763]
MLQPALRTFKEVETAGAGLLEQLQDGAALTSEQRRSLGQVLDSLERHLMHADAETPAGIFFPGSNPLIPVKWIGQGKWES